MVASASFNVNNNDWQAVKKNLSGYQKREVRLLEFLKDEFPEFIYFKHNPQNSPADGLKGDYWDSDTGFTYELKVDSYSAKNATGAIFIEYFKTNLKGGGLIPSGLSTTRADYHMFPVSEMGKNTLLIVPTKLLVMELLRIDFQQKTSGVGVNGNVGQFKSTGILTPIETLKQYATLTIPLPDDFFSQWQSWGV
jgi:hypothetical protein